jgi:ABC-type sugar transport system substrate-binding protein
MNNWQRCARMSVPALLALVLVSCGSSDGDDPKTSSADGSEAAAAAPEPLTTPPTAINVTTPLEAAPSPDKTLFWLQCELPICEKIGGGVQAATEAAGWNFESLVFKASDPGAGIDSAVQQAPDVIAITGIPSAAIESQLKSAADAGIPVVTCSPGPEEPSAETYAAICSQTTGPDGENLAKWAIKDSNGNAHMVMVTIPAFPSLQTTVDGMNSVLDEHCPDCSSGELALTVDDLAGGQVAAKLVAYLQSNPDTNYVVFNFGDLEIGVPEALEAAGFGDKVKLIGNGAGPQQFQALIDGGMDAAWVAYPAVYEGWEMVDAALRLVDGGTLPDGYQDSIKALPSYIVDTPEAAEALAPELDYEGPAGYQDQFKALWLVG